jgi:ATP-dependent DNA helicase PIF1
MAMSKERRLRMQGTDVLIIDEISMLESNQFRRLDRACRAARRCDAAFGGIQVVVTGDFYQLPPVKAFQTCFDCGVELKSRVVCVDCEPLATRDIHQPASPRVRKSCLRCGVGPLRWSDCPECGESYNMDDEWAFRSDTWEACGFHCVSLTQVHRQSDPAFIDMLNTLRIGDRLDEHQLTLLDGRERDVGTAIELSAVRKEVDQKNLEGFQAISGAIRAYRCQDHVHIQPHHPHLAPKAESDSEGNRVGCQDHRFPAALETKCGMPVILLANIDPGAGLVNGSQGRITGYVPHGSAMQARERQLAQSGEFSRFEEDEIVCWTGKQSTTFPLPVVQFENGVRRVVYPACQDTELGDPPPFSVIARTQIPLLPAWAITIHKSQGMTLERVVVNLDQIFEPQMAYVALSRARSLQGLKVVSRVGVGGLQERGRLGGGSTVVRGFMEDQFGRQSKQVRAG